MTKNILEHILSKTKWAFYSNRVGVSTLYVFFCLEKVLWLKNTFFKCCIQIKMYTQTLSCTNEYGHFTPIKKSNCPHLGVSDKWPKSKYQKF